MPFSCFFRYDVDSKSSNLSKHVSLKKLLCVSSQTPYTLAVLISSWPLWSLACHHTHSPRSKKKLVLVISRSVYMRIKRHMWVNRGVWLETLSQREWRDWSCVLVLTRVPEVSSHTVMMVWSKRCKFTAVVPSVLVMGRGHNNAIPLFLSS